MIQYIRYLRSLKLINLSNQVIGGVVVSTDLDSDRGFGQSYQWRTVKDGFERARINRKPILLLIHKSWCPACQKLKVKFSKSLRLIDLSTQFVMINVEIGKIRIGDEKKFQPDGKYVPRILFFTPDGDLIKDAYNRHPKADREHKYFYSSPAQIVHTMLSVLNNSYEDPHSSPSESYGPKHDIPGPTVLE